MKRSFLNRGMVAFLFTITLLLKSAAHAQVLFQEDPAAAVKTSTFDFSEDLVFPFESSIVRNQTSGHYIFAASPYLFIIDEKGIPVFFKSVESGVRHFKRFTDSTFTYYSNIDRAFLILDKHFLPLDTIRLVGDPVIDFHSVSQSKNGNLLLMGEDLVIMDMSEVIAGGQQYATVREAIIQEIDNENNVLFEWHSLDHIPVSDAAPCMVDLTASSIDYIHVNSVQADTDSTWIVSARNLNQVFSIDKYSGDIIWRLGGAGNDFDFINDTPGFSGQHSAFLDSTGRLSMFDNGNCKEIKESRGLVYQLDTGAKTAEKIEEFLHDPPIYSGAMGDFKIISENRNLIGWGKGNSRVLLSEYLDNEVVLEISVKEDFPLWSYSVNPVEWDSPVIRADSGVIDFGFIQTGDTVREEVTITNRMDLPVEIVGFQGFSDQFEIEYQLPFTLLPLADASLHVRCVATDPGEIEEDLTLYCRFDDGSAHPPLAGTRLRLMGHVSGSTSFRNEGEAAGRLKLYPNPVSSHLVLETELPVAFIEFFDMLGSSTKVMGPYPPGHHRISARHCVSGMNQVRIRFQNGAIETRSIMKLIPAF